MNPNHVLDFWLGTLDTNGCADASYRKRWWKKDPDFDAEIRARFETTYTWLQTVPQPAWRATPRGALAEIIVLDQFSRNMFRGSARSHESDRRAQDCSLALVEQGGDIELATDERVFAYMPLMHSESLERQRQCVALFEAFAESLSGPTQEHVGFFLGFAKKHRDIVADWGRFPHRNAILGRSSTPDELAFLKTPGSSF